MARSARARPRTGARGRGHARALARGQEAEWSEEDLEVWRKPSVVLRETTHLTTIWQAPPPPQPPSSKLDFDAGELRIDFRIDFGSDHSTLTDRAGGLKGPGRRSAARRRRFGERDNAFEPAGAGQAAGRGAVSSQADRLVRRETSRSPGAESARFRWDFPMETAGRSGDGHSACRDRGRFGRQTDAHARAHTHTHTLSHTDVHVCARARTHSRCRCACGRQPRSTTSICTFFTYSAI